MLQVQLAFTSQRIHLTAFTVIPPAPGLLQLLLELTAVWTSNLALTPVSMPGTLFLV